MLLVGPRIRQWVEEVQKAKFSPNAEAVGWGRLPDGIVCGAVFEGYNGANFFVHIAKLKGAQMPPAFIAAFLDYPFNQTGCRRITAAISERNLAAINFARKLGARQEGIMPEAHPDGSALLIFGLLRKDAAKWLTAGYQRHLGEKHGRSGQRFDCNRLQPRLESRQAASASRA